MFPTFTVDGRITEKNNVVGIAADTESMAFPVDVIVAERVINTTVGNTDLDVDRESGNRCCGRLRTRLA